MSVDCTLATLRAAAQSLGLGKSGGKSTVLRRIREHLVRHNLLEQHRARAEVEGSVQGREQRFVKEPSPEEVRLHQLTHLPYKEWCSACVSNRARSDRHERVLSDERQCSTFAFDFCYTARSSTPTQKLVCLVGVDSHTGAQQAWPIPQKGGTLNLKYLCAEICRLLNYLGHSEVTVKSDGEPTCLALQKLVKAYRAKLGLKTHLEQPEARDHQANAAEHAVDNIRQLTNTLLSVYEAETDSKVSSLSPVHSWAWRHASFLQQRFSRSQGVSPFELALGRPYLSKLVCFGETVFGRVRSKVKGQPRWCKGVWLGKLSSSDGHILFCAPGVFLSCRSIRRLPQRYSASVALFRMLRDNPYTQAAFLAGQMGQARSQKTQDPSNAAQEAAPAEHAVPGSQAPLGVPSEVAAEAPGAVDMPLPFPGYLLDDDAMLSELIPPVAAAPEPPTPVLDAGEPVTPVPPEIAMPASVAPELGTDVAMASTPEPLGDPSGSSGLVPETPRVSTRVGDDVPGGERKRLRLNAVSIGEQEYHHADEELELPFTEAELDELQAYDSQLWDDEWDDFEPEGEIPSILIREFSEQEPPCDDATDEAASLFEVDRLTRMGVLEGVNGVLEDHRSLSTRFVKTWRAKTIGGNKVWLRRARLVAREYAFLNPTETFFSPASSSIALKVIPAAYVQNIGRGWILMSLDVSDAYLTCDQLILTCTRVTLEGRTYWFKLWKCLPGQRDGSQRWFEDFTGYLSSQIAAEPMVAMPALFRLPSKQGAGLLHVDDLLSTGHHTTMKSAELAIKQKYKASVEFVQFVGDSLSFLKRVYELVSPHELVIRVPTRHIDRLCELTGLHKAKPRTRHTPMPIGRLPTEVDNDPELEHAHASLFRSAVGVLLYLAPDMVEAQYGIRYLASYMAKPTKGAWSVLKHLCGYLDQHRGYCSCISVTQPGSGLTVQRDNEHVVEAYSDSDWAGNRITRRSVSGCCILVNNAFVHGCSKSQKTVALSSAEAEYNSAVACAIDGILIHSMVEFVYPGSVAPLQLLVDSAAARGMMQRQGVGRVRHIAAKLLWLQLHVASGQICVVPVGTKTNPADIATKSLHPARIKFLLGLLDTRDADSGFERVGVAEASLVENGNAVRAVCKDLRSFAKRDRSGDAAKVLSVVLCALQASGVLGADDQDEPDDAESWMNYLVHILGYALAFAEQYPVTLAVVGQILLLGCMTFFIWRCLRPSGEASNAQHPMQNVEVHVNVGDRAFAKPLRGPEPAEEGVPAPGTPARPLRVETDDEGDMFEVPSIQIRIPRGARSKTKASPSRAAADPRINARGTNDTIHVPHEAGVGSNDPMPKAVPRAPAPLPVIDRVWIAPHQGKKYHKSTCSKALQMSMELVAISRTDAAARGYTPCKVCLPNLNL